MKQVLDISKLKDGQKIRYSTGKGILKEGNLSCECGDIISPVYVVIIVGGIVYGISKTWKKVVVLSDCEAVYQA